MLCSECCAVFEDSPPCFPWQAPRREFDVACAPFRLDVPDIVF